MAQVLRTPTSCPMRPRQRISSRLCTMCRGRRFRSGSGFLGDATTKRIDRTGWRHFQDYPVQSHGNLFLRLLGRMAAIGRHNTFRKKRLLMRSGYSPIQRVIGYSPRLPGGLLSDGEQDLSTASLAGIGDVGVTKQMEMRKAAATAFHETDCEQAIKNATLAGPRPHRNFEAGQVVYFWRRGCY